MSLTMFNCQEFAYLSVTLADVLNINTHVKSIGGL